MAIVLTTEMDAVNSEHFTGCTQAAWKARLWLKFELKMGFTFFAQLTEKRLPSALWFKRIVFRMAAIIHTH